jgi:diguanylate cyclase (GGDEF)-like protein
MDDKEGEYAKTLQSLLAVSQQQWLLVLEFDKRFQTIYDHRMALRKLRMHLQSMREAMLRNGSDVPALAQQIIDQCAELEKTLGVFTTLLHDASETVQKSTRIATEESKTLSNLKRTLILNMSALKSESMRLNSFKYLLEDAKSRLGEGQEFENLLEQVQQIIHMMAQLQQSEREHIESEAGNILSISRTLRTGRFTINQVDSWIFNIEKVANDIESTMREERQRVVLPLQRILGEQQLAEQLAKKAIAKILAPGSHLPGGSGTLTADVVARDIAQFTDSAEFQRYHDILLKFARIHPQLFDARAIRMLEHGEQPSAKAGLSRFFSLETFRNLAMTDALTKAYSRHFGNRESARVLNEAKRYQLKVSALMLDIDKFKSFNDTYGHDVGDRVLKRFADIVRNVLKRKEDSLIRWGGEEFVVLLPGANKDAALKIAEEILNEVALETVHMMRDINNAMPSLDPEARRPNVTLSIGVATFPDDLPSIPAKDVTFDQLLEVADGYLYAAKAKDARHPGRNRVMSSKGEIQGPDIGPLLATQE